MKAVARYHRLRSLTRIFFWAGCSLILIPGAGERVTPGFMPAELRDVAALAGLALLLAVFPLYRFAVNRCPMCPRSFSDAPLYADDDTPGVPLFQSLSHCPFCEVSLDEPR